MVPTAIADTEGAWSDDAVAQLHEGLLRHALQALHARGNAALKEEVLRWIFCPQAMVFTLHGPQGRQQARVLPQECTPFSFEQCCRICGYDPQRLRDGIAALLPAIGLASTHAQITRATGTPNDVPGSEPAQAACAPGVPQEPTPRSSA